MPPLPVFAIPRTQGHIQKIYTQNCKNTNYTKTHPYPDTSWQGQAMYMVSQESKTKGSCHQERLTESKAPSTTTSGSLSAHYMNVYIMQSTMSSLDSSGQHFLYFQPLQYYMHAILHLIALNELPWLQYTSNYNETNIPILYYTLLKKATRGRSRLVHRVW